MQEKQTMATSVVQAQTRPAMGRMIGLGIAGGLVGGLAFGLMMAAMNMLPMVAALIGQSEAFIGFIVHMGISALFGALFGVVATFLPRTWIALLVAGVGFGVVLWVGAALIAMPLMLGMNAMVLQIGEPQLMSLIGHIMYGVITAAVVKVLASRGA
jgi:uncharacterized membrane protein YagU involved in acid resistance